jgi:hypothetical protein
VVLVNSASVFIWIVLSGDRLYAMSPNAW